MKKIISYFLSGIVLCTALLVTHVSAAEVAPAEETITINSTVSVRATNYWTKTTTKLNSVYGTVSNISNCFIRVCKWIKSSDFKNRGV